MDVAQFQSSEAVRGRAKADGTPGDVLPAGGADKRQLPLDRASLPLWRGPAATSTMPSTARPLSRSLLWTSSPLRASAGRVHYASLSVQWVPPSPTNSCASSVTLPDSDDAVPEPLFVDKYVAPRGQVQAAKVERGGGGGVRGEGEDEGLHGAAVGIATAAMCTASGTMGCIVRVGDAVVCSEPRDGGGPRVGLVEDLWESCQRNADVAGTASGSSARKCAFLARLRWFASTNTVSALCSKSRPPVTENMLVLTTMCSTEDAQCLEPVSDIQFGRAAVSRWRERHEGVCVAPHLRAAGGSGGSGGGGGTTGAGAGAGGGAAACGRAPLPAEVPQPLLCEWEHDLATGALQRISDDFELHRLPAMPESPRSPEFATDGAGAATRGGATRAEPRREAGVSFNVALRRWEALVDCDDETVCVGHFKSRSFAVNALRQAVARGKGGRAGALLPRGAHKRSRSVSGIGCLVDAADSMMSGAKGASGAADAAAAAGVGTTPHEHSPARAQLEQFFAVERFHDFAAASVQRRPALLHRRRRER